MLKKNQNNNPGITLIALIITVIILLILAGVTFELILNSDLFGKAQEASYKTRMAQYKETVDIYVAGKTIDAIKKDQINSGEPLKEVIALHQSEGEEFDITEDDVNIPIKEIIDNIEERDEKVIVVYHGETYYVKSDKNPNAEQEAEWCLDVGIKILELKRPSGIENIKGNYEFVNGVYMNTPALRKWF